LVPARHGHERGQRLGAGYAGAGGGVRGAWGGWDRGRLDDGSAPGRAVQVDPIKPMLKAPGTKRLQLKYDVPLSNFAFKSNLRRYNLCASASAEEGAAKALQVAAAVVAAAAAPADGSDSAAAAAAAAAAALGPLSEAAIELLGSKDLEGKDLEGPMLEAAAAGGAAGLLAGAYTRPLLSST